MFPEGGPGIALLLLRISVAAILVMSAVHHLSNFSYLLVAGVAVVGALLLIGLFTPVSSWIAATFGLVHLIMGGHSDHSVAIFAAASILNAVALALLGPGAYSLDAKLFGRRVMIVPPPKDSN